MATYSPELLYKKMNDVQETFGALSQTSQFMVSLNLGRSSRAGTLQRWLTDCGLFKQSKSTEETYDFLCSQASLPGSTFDMAEISGDRQGVLERFPIRRIYSDFDLTFYVDKEYDLIYFFENWIAFIVNESGLKEAEKENYSYRVNFPNEYKTDIFIRKFERDYDGRNLEYKFLNAYPISIDQMDVSYDASELLLCRVNFNFSRYVLRSKNN